jgi:hypothetical protein
MGLKQCEKQIPMKPSFLTRYRSWVQMVRYWLSVNNQASKWHLDIWIMPPSYTHALVVPFHSNSGLVHMTCFGQWEEQIWFKEILEKGVCIFPLPFLEPCLWRKNMLRLTNWREVRDTRRSHFSQANLEWFIANFIPMRKPAWNQPSLAQTTMAYQLIDDCHFQPLNVSVIVL